MAKIVLWIFGLITLAFGIWSLVSPHAVAAAVKLGLAEPASVTEFRAFYGGLEAGIALFWIYAAGQAALQRGALLSMIFVWGGVALTRGAGILIDGSASGTMLFALGLEVGAAVASSIALRGLQQA